MARLSRLKLMLLSAVAAPCLIVGALWLARAPLGVWAATDYLRRQGAPARIVLSSLSPSGFTGSAVIGPAADPDLVIDHIEADYALFPDYRFAPRLNAVRLSGVKLKLLFDGKALRFGSLQALVDKALAAPPGGPSPRVQFDKAAVRLTTPAGGLILTGQGLIDDGRVRRLALAVAAPRLAQGDLTVANLTGTLAVTGGVRLDAQLSLAADALRAGDAAATAPALRAGGSFPYGRDPKQLLDGKATLGATLQAATVKASAWTATAAAARLDISGALAGGLDASRYAGLVNLALRAERAADASTVLVRPGLNMASSGALAAFGPAGAAAKGPVGGRAFADSATIDLGARALRLTAINLRGSGPASAGEGGFAANLSGDLRAQGALGPADTGAVADQIAPAAVFPALNATLRKALTAWRLEVPAFRAEADKGPVTVRLVRPARAVFSDGTLVLAAAPSTPLAAVTPAGTVGAARLTLAGAGLPTVDLAVNRYRLAGSRLDGAGRLTAKGDILPFEAVDLAAGLTLASAGADTVLRLTDCGPLSLALMRGMPDPLLRDFKAEVCPAAEPLAVVIPGRWRAAMRLNNLVSGLPGGPAALSDGVVQVRLSGAGSAKPKGTFEVSAGRLTDAMAPVRFSPLGLSGRFDLADDRVRGRLGVALAGRPGELAAFDVLHDLPSGAGRAILDKTRLTFVSDGLQPAQIAPMAAPAISKADGPVDVSAQVGWGPMGVGGSAHATIDGLAFTSAAGRLTGLRGEIDFPALVPAAVTAPDQHLTAARLETVVPLTDIDLRFALGAEALHVGAARASLAKGTVNLDPIDLPLLPGKTVSGVLHATGVDLNEIVSTLNLSDSVTIQARVEANLPFSLTPEGLRIAKGRIAAQGPGRLSIKRAALTGVSTAGGAATAASDAPGAPPPAPVPNNAVQDFAYQALENMAFDALDATVDSRPMGRLGVIFHMTGRHDPEKAQQARIGVLDLARGTAFNQPIPLPKGTPVELTLDTSLNFDDLMAAYMRMGRSDTVQP